VADGKNLRPAKMSSRFSGQLRLPKARVFLHCAATFQIMHWNTFLADAAAPQAAPVGATGTPPSQLQTALFGTPIFIYVLIFIAFYFILIRPSQKRSKQQALLVSSLKAGDKVVTASGIIGTVITVKDKTVSLRSADAKMEVTKASVTEILESSAATEA
jgi:preprotein translocase YajC subunit